MKKENPKIQTIDYKDTETLRRFINTNARIVSRKRTGLSSTEQRTLAQAIKRSRFMGLLPYVAR